jgi:hypothetical protein
MVLLLLLLLWLLLLLIASRGRHGSRFFTKIFALQSRAHLYGFGINNPPKCST